MIRIQKDIMTWLVPTKRHILILWNDVKNDSKKYEDTLVDLQKKIKRRQSKQLSFWSNLQSKPVEHPKAPAAKSSSCQKEKQSVPEPVEGM